MNLVLVVVVKNIKDAVEDKCRMGVVKWKEFMNIGKGWIDLGLWSMN